MKESIAKSLIRLSKKQFQVLERYKLSCKKELIMQTVLKYDAESSKTMTRLSSLFAHLKLLICLNYLIKITKKSY